MTSELNTAKVVISGEGGLDYPAKMFGFFGKKEEFSWIILPTKGCKSVIYRKQKIQIVVLDGLDYFADFYERDG